MRWLTVALALTACAPKPDPYASVPEPARCEMRWLQAQTAMERAAIGRGDFYALEAIDSFIQRQKGRHCIARAGAAL